MSQPEKYLRFPLPRRIEHWVTVISFTLLAVTGLPQKYAEAGISEALIRAFGGIELTRIIHRVAAVVLALVAIYHIGYGIYIWYVKRKSPSILLTMDDAVNAWRTLLHNLGREKDRPKQGFYTFEEKIEYWALIWGTMVMVVTGFFLWNPITAARYFPGEFIPAAKAAHGGEALLAVLSIIVWHLYQVIIRHFNKSMYTGYMSREEMEHEHPLALHEPPPLRVTPEILRRRKRQFWIGYGLVASIWLLGVFWFVTSEQTATASILEPQRIEVYTPLTPTPFPTSAPLSEEAQKIGASWNDGIGSVFTDRCGDCHNAQFGEANLDLSTYEGALKGGDSGPAIVPNAPGVSLVLIWPGLEDHPGKLSPAESEAIRAWLESGAPK
jgi:formate dehydrogenase gamma subunit